MTNTNWNTTASTAANKERRTTAGGVLLAATIATGLMAGLFGTYADNVMPALARSDDRVYIEVMQNIDDVIQNPVFLLIFSGALLLTAVSAWQLRGSPRLRWWVFAAFVAYALAFLVTVGFNIPLNTDLVDAGNPATIADPAAVREDFEDPWVAWNAVRTVLHVLAFALLTPALVRYGRHGRSRRQPPYLESAAGSSASR
ncbi:anthrone oxygenase family protein [Streptomyces sp. NPDC050704]|uniref:anthrone oxygenase family protein n=1 Tax=Streptomyces sp. NPDC050704 TaxID=3157219 RepID=UPI003418E58D